MCAMITSLKGELMTTQTQTEYDRNIRTAYRAIDAMQTLADRGVGSSAVERAMEHIRTVINEIESTPIRTRGKKEDE